MKRNPKFGRTKSGGRSGQSRFATIPAPRVARSAFNRTSLLKTTFNSASLTPVFVDEVLPGDTHSLSCVTFARLATPLHPVMDNIYLDYFFFFVPNRLVWDNWQKFNGEQENPGDSTDFLIPIIRSDSVTGFAQGSVFDYSGLPVNVPDLEVSALPFRGMNLIYNEWFRDQNLIDSVPVPKDNGPDDVSNYKVWKRGKRHDYFTGALPWPAKGPQVTLGIGGQAPLMGQSVDAAIGRSGSTPTLKVTGAANPLQRTLTDGHYKLDVPGAGAEVGGAEFVDPAITLDFDNDTGTVYADLSAATAYTINQLREAATLQQLYERDARGGTRYTEILRAHFGVVSEDFRLQRPELLCTGRQRVSVNPIAQTSSTDATTPQGNLAAMGIAGGAAGRFTKSFTEHGYIIGFVCARADLTYQDGVERHWSRRTRIEFYWPEFSNLGEQAILNKEIFAQGDQVLDGQNNPIDDNVFGYQERYAEYRYKPSRITGRFRSKSGAPLDTWHLSQDFDTLPTLSQEFIEENPPIRRIVAVQSEPDFLLDAAFTLRSVRPMPMVSVPGINRL